MVDFARLLGVDQSSISRWEAGKTIPSRPALLHYLRLSVGDERTAILKALKWTGASQEEQDWLSTLERSVLHVEASRDELLTADATIASFRHCLDYFRSLDQAPGPVLMFLALWMKYERWPEFRKLAAEVVAHLDRQCLSLKPATIPSEVPAPPFQRSDPRYREQVLWLMMNCPDEHKPFYTNFSMTQEQFDMVGIEGQPITCPVCGIVHMWGKKDVFLALPGS
jgi:transcriptional regulator with XRE-family HTH domain